MTHSTTTSDRAAFHFQGEVVRLGRWRRNMTQQELSALTGLAQSTISRLESGKDRDPPFSALMVLAEALDLRHVAFMPWGSMKPPSAHLATVHATLSGCIANHFVHLQGRLLSCLRYCLWDSMTLRPDLCGLTVKMMDTGSDAVYGAIANRQLEVVTHETDTVSTSDAEACVAHWQQRRPYVRTGDQAGNGDGFYEPVYLVDYPVKWGMVSWGFCAERRTESREQTLHWIGAASRTMEQCMTTYFSLATSAEDNAQLADRVARLEHSLSAHLERGGAISGLETQTEAGLASLDS